MNEAFETCKKVSEIVRKMYPTAILAGGALRDALILKQEPKDYDFFIVQDFSDEVLELYDQKMTHEHDDASENPGRVDYVVKKVIEGYEVDLVIVPSGHTVNDVLADFDLDICRVALLPDGSVFEDDRFREDWENKTVTNRRLLEQSRHRMFRIADKLGFEPVDRSQD